MGGPTGIPILRFKTIAMTSVPPVDAPHFITIPSPNPTRTPPKKCGKQFIVGQVGQRIHSLEDIHEQWVCEGSDNDRKGKFLSQRKSSESEKKAVYGRYGIGYRNAAKILYNSADSP